MIVISVGLVLFVVTHVASAQTAAAQYRNEEYGFAVIAPGGRVPCDTGDMEHRHGFKFFLDDGVNDCGRDAHRPHIYGGGDYNAVDDLSPEAVIASLHEGCERPHGLQIGNLPSASCRIMADDGEIAIFVVAQGPPRERQPGDGRVVPARINYVVTLHTNGARFEADEKVLLAFLEAMTVFEPKD